MRSRDALKAATDRDEYVDKLFLENIDKEKQRSMQKQEPVETWNLPDVEEEEKAFSEGFMEGSDVDIIDSLNDELEADTYDFMKDDTEWDSDDDLNVRRDES